MKKLVIIGTLFFIFLTVSCSPANKGDSTSKAGEKAFIPMDTAINSSKTDTATFAAGCFWCVEAVFQDVEGVVSVTSGYTGGTTANPNYKEVCSGKTGHAEALRIIFEPDNISYTELLEIFFTAHDPTTPNKQGNDVGTQYRSAVFYHNTEQKRIAEKVKFELDESHEFEHPIVTEITAESAFYPAENYHRNYFNENQEQPYCKAVIRPKVDKIHKIFKDKLKPVIH